MDGTWQLVMLKTPLSHNVTGSKDAPWLIVDAKYKNPFIDNYGDRFRNADLYQAFTYAAALDAPAVLVYPRVDRDVEVLLRAEKHEVRIVSVELAGESHKLMLGVTEASISVRAD